MINITDSAICFGVLGAFYLWLGQRAWGSLMYRAKTMDEFELVIGCAGASPWYVAGMWFFILIWPVWAVAWPVVAFLVKVVKQQFSRV